MATCNQPETDIQLETPYCSPQPAAADLLPQYLSAAPHSGPTSASSCADGGAETNQKRSLLAQRPVRIVDQRNGLEPDLVTPRFHQRDGLV